MTRSMNRGTIEASTSRSKSLNAASPSAKVTLRSVRSTFMALSTALLDSATHCFNVAGSPLASSVRACSNSLCVAPANRGSFTALNAGAKRPMLDLLVANPPEALAEDKLPFYAAVLADSVDRICCVDSFA